MAGNDGTLLVTGPNHPPSYVDEPANVVTAGSKGGATRAMSFDRKALVRADGTRREHAADRPGKTVRAATRGQEVMLVENSRHPMEDPDMPASTIRGGGGGHSAPQVTLKAKQPLRGSRVGNADEPGSVVTSEPSRVGAGPGQVIAWDGPQLERSTESSHGVGFSEPDLPAATVTRNTHSEGATLVFSDVVGKAKRKGPRIPQRERVGTLDSPAATVLADTNTPASSSPKLEWPWDRSSTTVTSAGRRQPPGHHAEGSYLSGPNAVILSERAAAILQGFPESWVFSGLTKKTRWGQLGMAMPPGLAYAVATSVVAQMAATRGVAPKEGRVRKNARP